jgi:hypothetical protein
MRISAKPATADITSNPIQRLKAAVSLIARMRSRVLSCSAKDASRGLHGRPSLRNGRYRPLSMKDLGHARPRLTGGVPARARTLNIQKTLSPVDGGSLGSPLVCFPKLLVYEFRDDKAVAVTDMRE